MLKMYKYLEYLFSFQSNVIIIKVFLYLINKDFGSCVGSYC